MKERRENVYTLEQKFIRSINYLKIINKIHQEPENKDCDKNMENEGENSNSINLVFRGFFAMDIQNQNK